MGLMSTYQRFTRLVAISELVSQWKRVEPDAPADQTQKMLAERQAVLTEGLELAQDLYAADFFRTEMRVIIESLQGAQADVTHIQELVSAYHTLQQLFGHLEVNS